MSSSVNPSYVGVRDDLLAAIPAGRYARVLDVGCASGTTSAELKRRYPEARVTGIELDSLLAQAAEQRLDAVLQGDALMRLSELSQGGERFDLVLCGDVLEHLVDPWRALKELRVLCSDGIVVVSLPNVAHWSTLATLFAGYWPYRERGIHDRTHLRFFARNNLKEFFAGAGFEETSRRYHHRLLERPHWINERLEPLLRWTPGLGRLTEYQFISVLR